MEKETWVIVSSVRKRRHESLSTLHEKGELANVSRRRELDMSHCQLYVKRRHESLSTLCEKGELANVSRRHELDMSHCQLYVKRRHESLSTLCEKGELANVSCRHELDMSHGQLWGIVTNMSHGQLWCLVTNTSDRHELVLCCYLRQTQGGVDSTWNINASCHLCDGVVPTHEQFMSYIWMSHVSNNF